MDLKIDPELESCLPPLPEMEYQKLRSRIEKKYDPAKPIVLWKERPGTIVDGHHRYKICQELGVEPVTIEQSFESLEDAVIYALQSQLSQRNLNDYQRVQVQEKLMGFEEMKRLKDEAKESQVRKPLDSVSAEAAETNQTKKSKEVARTIADKANVPVRTVYRAHRINNAVQELRNLVESGEVGVDTADKFISVVGDPEEQKRLIKSGGKQAITRIVSEYRAELKRKRKEKAELEKKAAQEKVDAEAKEQAEWDQAHAELKKKSAETAKSLEKEFGKGYEKLGRICIIPRGNTFENWCNDCKNGFDTFIGGTETKFCPYCGQKNIRERKPDWIPGNIGSDE